MNSSVDQLKDLSPMLAADLASDIWPPDIVFARHEITAEEAMFLMQSEWFKAMVAEAKAEWASLKNSKQRVRLKGQLALEEAIPTIYGLIGDEGIPAQARVAAFKELKDISGVGASAAEGGSAGTGLPSVTIYLGSPDGPAISINGSRVAETVEDAAVIEGLEILDTPVPSTSVDAAS